MRTDGFLRAPIRADHQSRIANIMVGDVALHGNPTPGDPYPQTLQIAFDVNAGVTEVQMAPAWPGSLQFLADTPANNPTDVAQVVPANVGSWSLTGDLILITAASTLSLSPLRAAFDQHLPAVAEPPDRVIYSKVRLTSDFLFTTLRQLQPLRLVYRGVLVTQSDPDYYLKLIIQFLQGKAHLMLSDDAGDPTKDDALKAMPSVALDAAGGRTIFSVTMANRAFEVVSPTWFDPVTADVVANVRLVDAAFQPQDRFTNPSHPSHSVIPAWFVFQSMAATAYAPDHSAATPVRAALTAARSDGRTWRRISVMRPPIPGAATSSAPERPFPQYQLCWQSAVGGAGTVESQRIPLTGHLYVPLIDDTYTLFAIPRNVASLAPAANPDFRFGGGQPAGAHYLDLPHDTLDVNLTGQTSATVYAHVQAFDSLWIWDRWAAEAPNRQPLKMQQDAKWNVDVLDFFIPTDFTRQAQYPIYGFVRESAGRHGLAPEFLLAVFMGEGGNQKLDETAAAGFDPGQVLKCFSFLGLDLILYRTGRIPAGKRLVPPEVPPGSDEEKEFQFNLVTAGYVDAATAAKLSWREEVVRNEAGVIRTLQVGNAAGWEVAIELVAAELHARLDEMTAFCQSKVPPIAITNETQRRFLAYLRFNTFPVTAKIMVSDLSNNLKRFPGGRLAPNDLRNPVFNSLQRVAVAEWQENAGVFR